MKKSLLVLMLASLLLTTPVGAADNKDTQGFVSVSYSTEKEVSPDTVEFSVTVKTSDKKSMQEASRKNKEISNKVYEYFKANLNGTKDYIKTANYRANPIYTYTNGKRNFDRYEVSNNIIVHTKSLDKISSLIDKSIEFGATDVNSLNFTLSDKDSQCAELLKKAAGQVRSRADVVAEAVGTNVAGVKEIRTSCSLNQRRVSYSNVKLMKANASYDAMGAAPEAASTNIEAGNITIYANIDADFYLK